MVPQLGAPGRPDACIVALIVVPILPGPGVHDHFPRIGNTNSDKDLLFVLHIYQASFDVKVCPMPFFSLKIYSFCI